MEGVERHHGLLLPSCGENFHCWCKMILGLIVPNVFCHFIDATFLRNQDANNNEECIDLGIKPFDSLLLYESHLEMRSLVM